jgi:hypothetical protein
VRLCRAGRALLRQLAQVEAGAERGSGGSQDEDADVGVRGEALDLAVQPGDHARGEGVALLRAVQGDGRDETSRATRMSSGI